MAETQSNTISKSKIDTSVFKNNDKYFSPLFDESGVSLAVRKDASRFDMLIFRNMKLFYVFGSFFAIFDLLSDLIDWTSEIIFYLNFSENCNLLAYGISKGVNATATQISDKVQLSSTLNFMSYNKDENIYYNRDARCIKRHFKYYSLV